ncbi:MAG: gliding motility-associated C-terminal domain-containing protein, partial [Bacteroidota bacterium]
RTFTNLVTLNQNTQITVTLNASSDISCNGGSDGSASITAAGGTPGYTYLWTGQGTGFTSASEDPVNLVADTYDLMITDGNGCSRTFLSLVTLTEPTVITATVNTVNDVSCPGGNDGSVLITAGGGTSGYTFAWTGNTSGYSSAAEDPVNMPADTYSLTITDSKGCSEFFADLATVSEPPAITVTVDGTTDVSCSGGNNGGAQITPAGGTPGYTYLWAGTGTGFTSAVQDPANLVADTYNLTITDSNGCSRLFNNLVTIGQPGVVSVVVDAVVDVACHGDATGSISITPTGGTSPYLLNWTGPSGFSSTNEDISGLAAGSYNLSVTDQSGCTGIFNNLVTINEPSALSAVFSISDASCPGTNDGAVGVTVSGGTPGYLYSWTGPSAFSSTNEDLTLLYAGDYELTVTDGAGCQMTFPVQTVGSPTALAVTHTQTDITCAGADNGIIDLTVSGGTPGYGFSWTGPSGFVSAAEDLNNLAPGTYDVIVSDLNGCTENYPGITITEPAALAASAVKIDISCAGYDDGEIDATVSGGTLPYTLAWSGPSGFTSAAEDLTGLAPGDYDLTITDGNGCVSLNPAIATIIEPSGVNVSLVSQTNVSCYTGTNGSIQIDVTGGVVPYTFAWTNSLNVVVSTVEDPTNLPASTYSLIVTDGNGCITSYPAFVIITQPTQLSATLAKTDVLCYGQSTGTITVTAAGGTSPYTYSRNGNIPANYQASNVFTNLPKGSYIIWTKDSHGCVTNNTITVNQPAEIQITEESRSGEIKCFGDSTAQIFIETVIGGVLPYEYSIDNGLTFSSNSLFTGLPAGDYQTVVRDLNGCTAIGNNNKITEPSPIVISSYTQIDITSCFDAPEGEILLSAVGGTGDLLYTLDGTDSNIFGQFSNISGGEHTVSISDENSCQKDTLVDILRPQAILFTTVTITDVTGCPGGTNGSIDVTATGGTGTLLYSLEGSPYGASGSFAGLSAGAYLVSVKDDNDCTHDTTINVAEPGPITITGESATPVSCTGSTDGSVSITVSGGTLPYNFTLNPGGATNNTGTFDNLAPGFYTVDMNDAAGCGPLTSGSLEVTEPPLFQLDSLKSSDISCFGAADGEIHIYVSGGVPPYNYSIDDRATYDPALDFTGLNPGSFEVWIQDSYGCEIYAGTVTLNGPAEIILTTTVTDVAGCFGENTGAISVSASGGSGTYEYSLDGSVYQASGDFTGLGAGFYTIFALDNTGCEVSLHESIDQPEELVVSIEKTDAFNALPGEIIIHATGGTPPLEFSIDGTGGTFTTDTIYGGLSEGLYPVVVRDANGCLYQEDVEILNIPPLDVTIVTGDVSCAGANDGQITFNPVNATGTVQYSIDNGASFAGNAVFTGLPGDSTYLLIARDEEGKEYTGTATISEPDPLEAYADITAAECSSYSETGSIDLTVSGGTGSYVFAWRDGSANEDQPALNSGWYYFEVMDENGCVLNDSAYVPALVILEANAGQDTTICQGETIQLNGQGGTMVSWSPATYLSSQTIADPVASMVMEDISYAFTVSEDSSPYGCYDIDTLKISVLPVSGVTAIRDTVIILGQSVELSVEGGPFASYLWVPSTGLDNDTSSTPVAMPSATTWYYLYVVNENGCTETDSLLIEVIEKFKVYNSFSPNGDGYNEYFEIDQAYRFPEMVVEVYARWGDKLFSSVGYTDDKRWDGTFKGKPAPVGTYYYVIIPYPDAKPITGNVTIVR